MSLAEQRRLFEECLELPPEACDARLAACADPELREQVRRLLEAHRRAEHAGDTLARGPTLPIPEQVGPYRILERLGEGAMGDVFLAEQVEPVRRQVALKIIKLGMDTREVIARFEMERQALALMSHPNVARILDAGATDSGRPYFVMEYVPGVPILRYCDEQRLGVAARLRLFLQACAGVQHAHRRGIIHRDLKPSNILVAELDGEPQPKIIDFGIAKATTLVGHDSPHTRLGNLLGTPGYMSPEQAELSPLDIDTRTDVYSLGAVLYELLTGTMPLRPAADATTPAALARALRAHEVRRPSERVRADPDAAAHAERLGRSPAALAGELREDLDWIVLKALERDRHRRYDSVAELCSDVQASLVHEPVKAGPPSALYRMRKLVRRHRVIAASGTALVGASLAFGSLMGLQARETAHERDRAATEAATAEQVSRVLVELFTAADPATARGRALSARELLDRAAGELARERDLQPRVRARLQNAIGEVYLTLRLYEEAYAQFESARGALDAEAPPADLDRLAAERGVARALIGRSRYDEAEPVLVGAAELARRSLPASHPLVGDFASDLAVLRYNQGRNHEAVRLAEEAYRIRAEVQGENSPRALGSLINLGVMRSRLGENELAEATLRDALARVRRHLGDDHPEVFRIGINLGAQLARTDRQRESRELYESLLPRARAVLGPTHGTTLTLSGNYAATLSRLGEHQQARQLLEQVHAGVREALGEESREAMFWETHLAGSLARSGRSAEAQRRLESLLRRQEAARGTAHFDTLNTRNALGDVLARQGRHEEAMRVVAPVPGLALAGMGPGSTLRRTAFLRLADASYALGRPADGARWWAEANGFELPADLEEYPTLRRLLAAQRIRIGPPDSASAAAPAAGGGAEVRAPQSAAVAR